MSKVEQTEVSIPDVNIWRPASTRTVLCVLPNTQSTKPKSSTYIISSLINHGPLEVRLPRKLRNPESNPHRLKLYARGSSLLPIRMRADSALSPALRTPFSRARG